MAADRITRDYNNMKIIVCIKQVPDTTDVKINPQTNTLIRDGVRSIVNPFDMYAIEEALRIRENLGGHVIAITMGPPQAKIVLEEAIAMGADDAILLSHRDFAGSDTLATSYALTQAIKKIGKFDLIICGKQATDGDTAQVGPGIASQLSIAQITHIRKITEISKKNITCERMTESGHDIITAKLPCLITVLKDINKPRYSTFLGKVKAKRMKLSTKGPKDISCEIERIGLEGSPTWVEKIFPPKTRRSCMPLAATDDNLDKTTKELYAQIGSLWE